MILARFIPAAGIAPYESMLLIYGLITFFWINGLLDYYLTGDGPAAGENSNLKSILVLFLLFSSLCSVFLLVFPVIISEENPTIQEGLLQRLIPFVLLFPATHLIEAWYLRQNKGPQLLFVGGGSYLLFLLCVVCPVLFGNGLPQSVALLDCLAVLRFALLLYVVRSEFQGDWKLEGLRTSLYLSGGFILYYAAGSSIEYINGMIAAKFFSPEEFIFYRFGAKEFPLTLLLANGLSTSALIYLSPAIGNKDETSALRIFRAKVKKLQLILFPSAVLLMLCSDLLFEIFYGPQYSESAAVFRIFLLITCSRLLFPQTILKAARKSRMLLIVSVSELILSVSLSLVLIPYLGISGLAAGTAIAFIFEKFALIFLASRHLSISMSNYTPLGTWLTGSGILLISYLLV